MRMKSVPFFSHDGEVYYAPPLRVDTNSPTIPVAVFLQARSLIWSPRLISPFFLPVFLEARPPLTPSEGFVFGKATVFYRLSVKAPVPQGRRFPLSAISGDLSSQVCHLVIRSLPT